MEIHTIAIVGGTGKEGKGLAYRWIKAGYTVIIGSRQIEKALLAVEEILTAAGEKGSLVGKTNLDAVEQADIVIMTVPYAFHNEMLQSLKEHLAGKIFVDVTVPLVPPKVSKVQMPKAGSAAQEAREILGENVSVVSAFQNISYENLMRDDYSDCDVLVCGSDLPAREAVLKLVEDAGLTGWDAGPLENSVVLEGLTSVLIGINKKYGSRSSGIRITGVERNKQ
jgi:8-hydroxy-5-deazaflavin:NADPH oxidoreductase